MSLHPVSLGVAEWAQVRRPQSGVLLPVEVRRVAAGRHADDFGIADDRVDHQLGPGHRLGQQREPDRHDPSRAVRLGTPGTARAVGQALGHNPFPIVVPCHRVLAADGRMGGFSAPGGVVTKRRMLAIEGVEGVRPEPTLF